jgi:hypothetical protein
MPNMELANDDIMTIPIMGRDAAGDPVPLPPGRTPTIVCSDPASMNAVITATSYTLNALVPTASNITIEIDDGTLTPEITVLDIVADVTATSVVSQFSAATHAVQPVPTAAPPPPPPPPPPPTP